MGPSCPMLNRCVCVCVWSDHISSWQFFMSVCWHFYGVHISYIVSPDGVETRFSWYWWSSTKTYSPNDWSTWRGQRKSVKLVVVVKRTFPRMKGFKRGFKIDTWILDQWLTLKDQPSQKLADRDKVCTYTYVHITDYPCQMSWLLHIDLSPPLQVVNQDRD